MFSYHFKFAFSERPPTLFDGLYVPDAAGSSRQSDKGQVRGKIDHFLPHLKEIATCLHLAARMIGSTSHPESGG
jgi:hypothetical protein